MARFEITAGKPFDSVFVIKENGTTLAKELVGDETGEFVLTKIRTTVDDPVPVKTLTKSLSLGNLLNGEFNLSLDITDTTGLEYEIGAIEDGAKFKATYRANLSFYNGDGTILAETQIPQIFIIFEGE